MSTIWIRFKNLRMTRNRSKWYQEHACPACGRVNDTGKLCDTVRTCKVCGIVQCGGSSCRCAFCEHGLLDGFFGHDKPCDYAQCDEEGVARGKNGKRHVCQRHLIHQFGAWVIPSEIQVGEAMRDFSSYLTP